MKAPDKIFIAETPNKLIEIWSDEPIESKPYITEHEYIRKDALIEWLKENLQEACDEEGIPFEYYENGIITGKISAFEQVIIKLISM